jgi:hypothetical protein
MNIQYKAEYFAEKYGGVILDSIIGKIGTAAYRVRVDDKMFHIFYNRRWYMKYDGISISQEQLNKALEDFAMIVIFMNDEEYWKHSTEWTKGMQVPNSKFNTYEILVKRTDLNRPPIPFPIGVDSW